MATKNTRSHEKTKAFFFFLTSCVFCDLLMVSYYCMSPELFER